MKRLVQIGANTGVGDLACDLVSKEGFWGLFVEPNPNSFEVLKKKTYAAYADRAVFEQLAVAPCPGKAKLHIDNFTVGAGISPHASLSLDFQHKHGHGKGRDVISIIEVECVTVLDLFKKHGLEREAVEWLFIDAEGLDADIILATDFSLLNVRRVFFEHMHTDGVCKRGEKYARVLKHLREHGFVNVRVVDEYNTVAEKP